MEEIERGEIDKEVEKVSDRGGETMQKGGFCISQKGNREKQNGRAKKQGRRILMWNIVGLNKDKKCWKFIKSFDFISLCETWVKEKNWNKIKRRTPTSHNWVFNFAIKEKKKGRAKGV